ncbi:MAG: acyltransferase [Bacteroidetes bacterium]|nr:acyltransferase [Bacteroidota bacterium]
MNKVRRRHFHTFDALRFFAYLKVFLQHLPIFAFPWFYAVMQGGGIGVEFFFVLSGFLITYIICEEKKQTGTVNLKNFFVRRVLRIWPLFYLMIGVAFITPHVLAKLHMQSSAAGYEPNWWMSLLFLENYKMIASHTNPNVSPLAVMWSLCVEEHFYIIWGLLLYAVRIKTIPKIIAFCLVLSVIARIIFVANNWSTSDILTNIDLFAYGAIPAYLLVQYPAQLEAKVLAIPMWAKWLFTIILISVVFVSSQLAGNERPFIWLSSILGILFSTLIILIIPERSKFRISDGNILSRLGIYTYGFYLYHTLVINLINKIFIREHWSLEEGKWATTFVVVTFAATLVCSIASYHLFEKQFLKLKKYFR